MINTLQTIKRKFEASDMLRRIEVDHRQHDPRDSHYRLPVVSSCNPTNGPEDFTCGRGMQRLTTPRSPREERGYGKRSKGEESERKADERD